MKLGYVTLLGQKHPLCFSLAATEEIVDEFGSIEAMQEKLTSKDVKDIIKTTDKVLTILMKAGRRYAIAAGEPVPEDLPGRPADFIGVGDKTAMSAILDVMGVHSAQTVRTEGKNAEATQSEAALRGCTTTEPAQV